MNERPEEIRLKIELVPSTSWYDNLRKYTSKEDWNKIRKRVYANYGYRCGICSTKGRLNCHEIWEYDDKEYIQRLIGFVALCDLCHHVKHIGHADILADEGKLDYEKIVEHFMRVNDCSRDTFEKHREKAVDEWKERSSHEWQLDLGEYKNIIKPGVSMNWNKEEEAGGLTVRSIDTIEQAKIYYQHLIHDDCYQKKDVVGHWFGKGAAALGLAGEIKKDDFDALICGEKPTGKHIVEPSYGKAEGNFITTDEIKQYFFCPYAYLYGFMGKVGASMEKDKKKRLYGRKQQHRKLETKY